MFNDLSARLLLLFSQYPSPLPPSPTNPFLRTHKHVHKIMSCSDDEYVWFLVGIILWWLRYFINFAVEVITIFRTNQKNLVFVRPFFGHVHFKMKLKIGIGSLPKGFGVIGISRFWFLLYCCAHQAISSYALYLASTGDQDSLDFKQDIFFYIWLNTAFCAIRCSLFIPVMDFSIADDKSLLALLREKQDTPFFPVSAVAVIIGIFFSRDTPCAGDEKQPFIFLYMMAFPLFFYMFSIGLVWVAHIRFISIFQSYSLKRDLGGSLTVDVLSNSNQPFLTYTGLRFKNKITDSANLAMNNGRDLPMTPQKQFNLFASSATWDKSFSTPTIYFDQLWNKLASGKKKFNSSLGFDRFILASGIVDAIGLLPLAILNLSGSDKLFTPFIGLLMATFFIFRHMLRFEFRPTDTRKEGDLSDATITRDQQLAKISEMIEPIKAANKAKKAGKENLLTSLGQSLINALVQLKQNRTVKLLQSIRDELEGIDVLQSRVKKLLFFQEKLVFLQAFRRKRKLFSFALAKINEINTEPPLTDSPNILLRELIPILRDTFTFLDNASQSDPYGRTFNNIARKSAQVDTILKLNQQLTFLEPLEQTKLNKLKTKLQNAEADHPPKPELNIWDQDLQKQLDIIDNQENHFEKKPTPN